MFKRVFFPTVISLILLLIPAIAVFVYFNCFFVLKMFDSGYACERGLTFLIQKVAAFDDPATNQMNAQEFLDTSVNFTLYTVYAILNVTLLLWLLLGKLAKVNKPGEAEKYMKWWVFIAILGSIGVGLACWWWLWVNEGRFYMIENLASSFSIIIVPLALLTFWIQSLLFTSKAMKVAVPFASLFNKIKPW